MSLFKLNKNDKLEKYLNKLYYKCDQHLYLHSEYVEEYSKKRGTYFDQEIFVAEYSEEMFEKDLEKEAKRLGVPLEELKLSHDVYDFVSSYDKYLFTIQTLDSVMIRNYSDLGHVPYYQVKDWERLFTVQRFGQLTDKDIFFAIEYFLNKIIGCLVFNIKYNGKNVHVDLEQWKPDYKKDDFELKSKKYWTEKKYPGVWI